MLVVPHLSVILIKDATLVFQRFDFMSRMYI